MSSTSTPQNNLTLHLTLFGFFFLGFVGLLVGYAATPITLLLGGLCIVGTLALVEVFALARHWPR